MPNNPLLTQLHDIHAPDAVSIWPFAPIIWIIIGLSAALIIAALLGFFFYVKPRRYRKQAQKQLQYIHTHYHGQAFLLKTAEQLKKAAILRHPESAQLSGLQWQQFLSQSMDDNIAELLAVARYQKQVSFEQEQVYQAAAYWLRKHL